VTATEVQATVRPERPRRAWSLLPALIFVVVAMMIGAVFALQLGGLIWGIVGGLALAGAFRIAKTPLSMRQEAAVIVAVIVSAMLSTRIVPDVPEQIGVALVLRFAGAWAVTAVTIAIILWQRGSRPSAAVNTALAWLGAAAMVLPAAATFDVLVPLEYLNRNEEPVYGAGFFVFAAFTVGLIGGAASVGTAARLPVITLGASILFLTVFAGAQVGFSVAALFRDFGKVTEVPNFWPPDFGWAIGDSGTWWWPPSWEFGSATRANPLIETFRIAIIASVIGCTLALPLAFLASQLTAPNTTWYTISKSFMNLIRTMPDLFWAMLFVTSVGVGPFAGALALVFFSLAIMSKLLSETVDGADPGPLEAAKATGGSHFPAVRSSVLPQVLPNYVAYALYIFEINIRASVVIGLAGAGGIGRVLEAQRSFFRFDRVLAIVAVIFVIVFIIEQISVAMRRRLV
jgi:phosphonate transport system permease protein